LALPEKTADDRVPCPSCKGSNTIVTFERFGFRTFYCPDCNHNWVARIDPRPQPRS